MLCMRDGGCLEAPAAFGIMMQAVIETAVALAQPLMVDMATERSIHVAANYLDFTIRTTLPHTFWAVWLSRWLSWIQTSHALCE